MKDQGGQKLIDFSSNELYKLLLVKTKQVNMFSLENKIALVTGATGGIGESIARTFHQAGAKVILTGRNEEKLKSLSEELAGSKYIAFDLSEKDKIEEFFNNAIALFDGLDILVCNSGITKDNLSMRMSLEDFEQVMNVNCTSVFLLNKFAGKYLMKRKWGRVINISSVVGTTGNAGQVNYAASKGAIIAMTKSFAKEYATRSVTFNAIAPGFITTNMTDVLPDNVKENILSTIPAGRMGNPIDIASSALFLASDEASYITGQTLHVNGGMLMI